jgi:hypothetical protein
MKMERQVYIKWDIRRRWVILNGVRHKAHAKRQIGTQEEAKSLGKATNTNRSSCFFYLEKMFAIPKQRGFSSNNGEAHGHRKKG